MLPKTRRIEKKLFELSFRSSKRYNSTHLMLFVANNKENISRFSFSISKKICKNAVDRNRLRRQGYSIIKKHISDMPNGLLFFFSSKILTYPVVVSELDDVITGLLNNLR